MIEPSAMKVETGDGKADFVDLQQNFMTRLGRNSSRTGSF